MLDKQCLRGSIPLGSTSLKSIEKIAIDKKKSSSILTVSLSGMLQTTCASSKKPPFIRRFFGLRMSGHNAFISRVSAGNCSQ